MSRANSSSFSVAHLSVREFLQVRHLPGRYCAWQFAAFAGCETHHVPIIIAARLIKPLGNPPVNAPKFFSREEVLRLTSDERWLAKMSDALVSHWAKRNSKKKAKKNNPLHSNRQ